MGIKKKKFLHYIFVRIYSLDLEIEQWQSYFTAITKIMDYVTVKLAPPEKNTISYYPGEIQADKLVCLWMSGEKLNVRGIFTKRAQRVQEKVTSSSCQPNYSLQIQALNGGWAPLRFLKPNRSKSGGEYTLCSRNLHFFCTCHNFSLLSSVQIIIIPACCLVCALKWYIKSLYRHLFLEDISKHARVTKKMALPNLWQT